MSFKKTNQFNKKILIRLALAIFFIIALSNYDEKNINIYNLYLHADDPHGFLYIIFYHSYLLFFSSFYIHFGLFSFLIPIYILLFQSERTRPIKQCFSLVLFVLLPPAVVALFLSPMNYHIKSVVGTFGNIVSIASSNNILLSAGLLIVFLSAFILMVRQIKFNQLAHFLIDTAQRLMLFFYFKYLKDVQLNFFNKNSNSACNKEKNTLNIKTSLNNEEKTLQEQPTEKPNGLFQLLNSIEDDYFEKDLSFEKLLDKESSELESPKL